ncbi:Replication protein A 14 kDa subunit B [Hondaea fermentalgiana]|uniref:Replication protein A 14 kDa subunit B n=1 Tax=Hondaea fermentalgiana TaxID=2315210 RepID=A0A2R5G6K8_9STRA|nr:Replication protein A 14 kDa subunit B [Hondaea fermentalgiana]|eukprot:GBG24073.1 Replication protein A 14 kDa subunit B [Hondaea fermentalgiana]
MLSKYQDQKVILVGKVLPSDQAGPGMFMLLAADNQQVAVQMQDPETTLSAQQIYEVLGTVSSEGTMLEEVHFPYSDNFDLENYNRMLNLAHGKFSNMFWD